MAIRRAFLFLFLLLTSPLTIAEQWLCVTTHSTAIRITNYEGEIKNIEPNDPSLVGKKILFSGGDNNWKAKFADGEADEDYWTFNNCDYQGMLCSNDRQYPGGNVMFGGVIYRNNNGTFYSFHTWDETVKDVPVKYSARQIHVTLAGKCSKL